MRKLGVSLNLVLATEPVPQDHYFGPIADNSIGISADTSLNNHIRRHGGHPRYTDLASIDDVRPITKVAGNGVVTQGPLTRGNRANGTGTERVSFVNHQNPLRYDVNYRNGFPIAHHGNIPRP